MSAEKMREALRSLLTQAEVLREAVDGGASNSDLVQMVAEIQAAEREWCAKLCDEQERQWLEAARLCGGDDGNEVCRANMAAELAAEIRATDGDDYARWAQGMATPEVPR